MTMRYVVHGKVPLGFFFVSELPRSSAGKVLKAELAARPPAP